MPAKGTINPNALPQSQFEFKVPAGPTLVVISVGSMDTDLEKIQLPDRTAVASGNTGPLEIEAVFPEHHTGDQAYLHQWWLDSHHPVAPNYKRNVTVIKKSADALQNKEYLWIGTFPIKRSVSELDMANESDEGRVSYTFSVDEVNPLS